MSKPIKIWFAFVLLISTALSQLLISNANATSNIALLNSGFTWAGSKSTSLGPSPAGWNQIVTLSRDDRYESVPLGFNFTFEGTIYNTVRIQSNTYVTFDTSGATTPYDLNNSPTGPTGSNFSPYSSLTPNNPPLPGIHFCSRDNSYQRVYYRTENSGNQIRFRYEGATGTTGTVGSPTIIYELLLTKDSSVIDFGIGIPVQEQKNLFQSFYRASNVENIQGTGLGLTIVKQFVEMHQGTIQIKSQQGKGTEVILNFKYTPSTVNLIG